MLVTCGYRRVHNTRTLCLLHTQGCAAAHKHVKYSKSKDYNVKDYYCVSYINIKCLQAIMDSHCMYQNEATYLLVHKQRFLSRDAFSVCSFKLCGVNSESAMARAQLPLKGNER